MKKFVFAGILILACFFLYLIAGFMGPTKNVIKVVVAYGAVVVWILLSAYITRRIYKKIDEYIKTLN